MYLYGTKGVGYITVYSYITGGFGHIWVKLTSEEGKETTQRTFDNRGHQKFWENVELTVIPYEIRMNLQ